MEWLYTTSLGKPKSINTCEILAAHFVGIIENMLKEFNEGHLLFDNYSVENSLKAMIRRKRSGNVKPVVFHVKDTTSIANINMKQFLSRTKTKAKLTVYLAEKCCQDKSKTFIVTSQEKVMSNGRPVQHLETTQEEADRRLLLHAVDATQYGAQVLHIFSQSPKTQMFWF